MGLYKTLPAGIDEVDVIIAGGGTAGCIIAARLAAAADPSLSILVVESGPDNWGLPTVTHPVFFLAHVMPGSTTAKFHASKSPDGSREVVVPTAQVLGGGSSINMMMYTRPQRSDFEDWGVEGWRAEEILPYFKKFETYHGKGDKDRHGYHGPIHVSDSTFQGTKVMDDFLAAAGEVGYPEADDMQSLDAINGAQRAMRFVDKKGVRQDTAHRYLHPLLRKTNGNEASYPNLHVLVETQVERILIENGRAVGVVISPSSSPSADDGEEKKQQQQVTRTIRATKSVVVSCGALGSPALLERSGVGSTSVLTRAGVETVVDLPGVGENYQDHQLLIYAYQTDFEPKDTLDVVVQGRVTPEELIADNSPILGTNAQDMTGKFRPSDDEVAALGPDFQKAWDEHYKNRPDKPLVLMSPINGFPGHEPNLPEGQYFGLSTFSVYPFSRGSIHITGPSAADPTQFDAGFFSDHLDLDVKKHIWAYKKQREIIRRMRHYRGEYANWHPRFAATSPAACISVSEPLSPEVAAEKISYGPEDDAAIEAFIREKVGTTWHSLGTCKMASQEEGGVVDARLGVHGVEGLKVADLSVLPVNIGANSNSMALALGEKAADLLIQDLALN